jgi:hypothetical protein
MSEMNKYGVCLLPVLPVRKKPDETAEMITQVLFGETVRISDQAGDWYHIVTDFDNYPGWISSNMITFLTEDEFVQYQLQKKAVLVQPVGCYMLNQRQAWLPAGSEIIRGLQPLYSIKTSNRLNDKPLPSTSVNIATIAGQFYGAPYLWGGRTCFGIDCSGFVQMVYKCCGINLPRDTGEQIHAGTPVINNTSFLPGDVMFFGKNDKKLSHVGIYLGDGMVIHASGTVRTDKVNETGIYSTAGKQYSHSYLSTRRIIKNS